VTYVAAHWDLTHLLGNVAMLLLAGWFVEIAMGRVRFAALVIIATVVSIPVEQLLDWHDGTATNLGGASGLTFALAGACLVGAVSQVVRYRNGEVGDLAYSATGIVVLMSVMSLAGNIASGATEEQGSDLVVAWGSHNLGWVIGVVLALALCPGVIPGAWSATREALSDARFNRASRARVRALQRAL
jgi:membrane associated rhomboid family serine protease